MRRGFPIRTSADQRSLASPRGFSQRATSFIAFWRQGIHRTPLSHSLSPPPPARRTKPRHDTFRHQAQSCPDTWSAAAQLTQLHTSKADHSPNPSPGLPNKGLPDNAARLRSTKSDSPFERTCPTPAIRPAPGNLLREGSTEQAFARSRYRFDGKPAQRASLATWRLTDSNR